MCKKILIMGGSRGIGAECVRRFSNGKNKVAFVYRNSDDAALRLKRETSACAIKADLSDPHEAERACAEAIAFLGGVDVLVNNVGVSVIACFDDVDNMKWRNLIDTNLSSVFYAIRAISPFMIRQKNGSIINIGSVWGRVGASCEVHYSATKAAIRGLTMALAKELGPSGITVNCVEPGVINTDMLSSYSDDDLETLASETPLGRIGEPSDVAALVCFLASDSAAYITGQCIGVDGGFGS